MYDMTRVLGFLIRYFSNYYTLHRSDLAARAAPLDPRLQSASFNKRTLAFLLCLCLIYLNQFFEGKLQKYTKN